MGMFPERMEFWNRVVFQDLLDRYAISQEEDELLVEIDSALVEIEEEDDKAEDSHHRLKVYKQKRGRKGFFSQLKSRGRKHGNWRQNVKRKMSKKRKRLAKRLKLIKCN